nr:CusA/CzcA family heavy metal efflux RND transporter [Pontibacter sp. E15-1]
MALVVWGGYSLTQLPIDAVPDITNNQVQVITVSPSLAAQEVERLISFPVEQTMATIPDVEEIRSFSRFGLSVVTIVFDDKVDEYWARQQVNERLGEAKQRVPQGIGTPEMAPLTTGLGEIYQYVLATKPGFEQTYTAVELRTIQDWIVKRQLLGTPGVADVSSFGGKVKQYEVAIDPARLRSMRVSIQEIMTALERNNQNTGGAYIDKNPNAYFIRSEGLLSSLDDISKVVVRNGPDGVPILIGDVAEVQFGHAVRYGALTRNTEGEKVGGIVMMLKGANSSKVISAVKEQMAQIEKSLPEGVFVDPFLDRTRLVDNAIGTVTKNLAEGALIVIFVLVLLLGNLRAGLVVASVIPLAMLFAISMMNLFGVSGNLMSLGAIDFGLIVDGAVIIVEATMHHLGLLRLGRRLTQAEMDEEVYESARKIRSAAAFGEIIILIVYLPILALVGTEGRMFGPMAQVVSFAILGAFLLSLTYVPMMSALFLNKEISHKKTVSDKIMGAFHRAYDPVIRFALRRKLVVILTAVALFAVSLLLFLNMGGEFIPTLEEGDFAVETRVMTGSSVSHTIEMTQKASKIILDNFPEVKEVVAKIGSGEIPTDPMPIEAADLMIILKDRDEWVSASNREELAAKMKEALEVLPGVTFGFQQPIQMRFNELMTGARQDVVLKIYGEDLDLLTTYAGQIGRVARTVEGAQDVYVEEVTGLPQFMVTYNRDQLAKFGLSVDEVNQVIQTGFAGQSAGLIYEGERRFDLVVRLSEANRSSMDDMQNLFVTSARGEMIPIRQVADIQMKTGPNQIQRDNAQRRIMVGFNVRGRDVESIVEEIGQKVEEQVNFEPGYYVTYGGQFENLQEAQKRLSIAVPLALLLIFVLLYFTFGSMQYGLLIFTAIPLSAIGGVLALYLRAMPFSISAGVGFIALFGVAVLNGIVLVSEFNNLKKEGLTDLREIVLRGTRVRLRPVIMTATVASLGFLPMALSQGAGAEVQRPLATVVIGGLVTATLLTLVVLPVLYVLVENYAARKNDRSERGLRLSAPVVLLLLTAAAILAAPVPTAQAQQGQPVRVYTLEQAVESALRQNPSVEAARLNVKKNQTLKGAAWDIDKTQLQYTTGKLASGRYDKEVSVTQTLAFPTVYSKQAKVAEALVETGRLNLTQREREIVREVRLNYYGMVYAMSRLQLLAYQDSLYTGFLRAAQVRLRTGETNLLEKVTAESQLSEVRNSAFQAAADRAVFQKRLQALLATDSLLATADSTLHRLPLPTLSEQLLEQNPQLRLGRQQVALRQAETELERARLLPDFKLGYTNRTLGGSQAIPGTEEFEPNQEVSIGIAVPLWAKPQKSRIEAAKLEAQLAQQNLRQTRNTLEADLEASLQQALKLQASLDYYEGTALPQAELIIRQATKAYRAGEIDYQNYILSLNRALSIRTNYLEALYTYDRAVIALQFIIENQR